MSIIKNVLMEEFERLERMEKSYRDKVNKLPKGALIVKNINNRQYNYLVYRENQKVIQKYLKLSDKEIEELKKKIEQRRKFEKILREIKKDYQIIKRALKQ
ncbi:MAG: hypothetical protein GX918_03350 [Clostridiales bacterium]|nr:hypothetical protein [Clostridiales bacterium]